MISIRHHGIESVVIRFRRPLERIRRPRDILELDVFSAINFICIIVTIEIVFIFAVIIVSTLNDGDTVSRISMNRDDGTG